jgi:hypothetical protein
MAILSGLFLGLFIIPSPALALGLALLAAWFASINFGALFHLAARVTATDSYATLFGFINFLANLSAILFTLMFGLMKDTMGSFHPRTPGSRGLYSEQEGTAAMSIFWPFPANAAISTHPVTDAGGGVWEVFMYEGVEEGPPVKKQYFIKKLFRDSRK